MKVKELRKRANKCWMRRRLYDGLLRDVYDYVIPLRDVSGLQQVDGGRPEADRRTDKVFDATAPRAAYRFATRMQTDAVPLFQEFFSIEAGPLLPDDDNKKQLTEEYQRVAGVVHGVLSSGEFTNAAQEMFVDLYAGMGHMQILAGDAISPLRIRVVPVPEVAVEEGPFGQIERWYWKRKWAHEDLPRLWPEGKFSDKLKDAIRDRPEDAVEVCQYTYYDADAKDYKLLVWCDKCSADAEPFWRETFRTCPWVTPRFFKIPGEPYGRGPANLAMPFVKTANKARELALKAAALSIMGIWMRRNDGVFNPDTIRFEPLAMWSVATTGGPLGPTLARLPIPQDFNISSIVMADEREQMKMALFDETLPTESGAVRSATEIAERVSRLSQDHAGVAGRLTLEFIVPVVVRALDLLEQAGMLNTTLRIDQLVTMVRLVGRIASAQMAHKVQQAVYWLDILQRLGGEQLMMLSAKVEEFGPELGRWLGIPEKFIRSKADREALMKMAAQALAAQQQAAAQAAAPQGQAGASPAAALVNGGAA